MLPRMLRDISGELGDLDFTDEVPLEGRPEDLAE